MVCRIHRDLETEEILRVTNPEGNSSVLYKEALKVTGNPEEALNIWAVAYSPNFGEWSQEPSISEVMDYINKSNTESLSIEEVTDVLDVSKEMGLQPEELFSKLQGAFLNNRGQFIVDKKRLQKSGLYTEDEIEDLMTFPHIRATVFETINKMRTTLSETDLEVTSMGEAPIKVMTSEKNSIGRGKQMSMDVVDEYLLTNLTSTKDISNLSDDNVREAIEGNKEALDYVKILLNTKAIVPTVIVRDGEVISKSNEDLAESMLQTVTVNESKLEFTKVLDQLREISDESWYTQFEQIIPILRGISEEAADIGIDIIGIENKAMDKTREEIIGFLEFLDDFNVASENSNINESDVIEVANEINDFFDRQETINRQVVAIPSQFKGKELTVVEGEVNEEALYKEAGLVRAFGNVFQKVPVYSSYNEALAGIPLSRKMDIMQLNQQVNTSAPLTEDYETSKIISLIKINSGAVETKTPQDLSLRFENMPDNKDYLATDYVYDFYRMSLLEKLDNSPMWDKALKYFKVNSLGIDFYAPVDQVDQVKEVLKTDNDLYTVLRDYAIMSKNSNLDFLLTDFTNEGFNTIETRRVAAYNHPESVNPLTVDYTRVSENTVVTNNETSEFVTLMGDVYELTDFNQGVSVYSKIDGPKHPLFYVYEGVLPVVETIDTQDFRSTSPSKVVEDRFKSGTKGVEDALTC